MDITQIVIAKHIKLARNTLASLGSIIAVADARQLTELSDGDDGWTVTEVICHLRDSDTIFRQRAQMILDEEHPELPVFDHEGMAIEYNYREDDVHQAYQALVESRTEFIDFFKSLADEDWMKSGIHPESGEFSLLAALMQIGHHDALHIEQITRIIASG